MLDYLGSNTIAAIWHEKNRCIYEEADAVISFGIDDIGVITAQMDKYRQLGFPAHFGLHNTNCLLRKHSDPRCRTFCELWWQELYKQSKRDQLSFDFIRWATRENITDLQINLFENDLFKWGDGNHGEHPGDRYEYMRYWAVPGAPFQEQPPLQVKEYPGISEAMSSFPPDFIKQIEKLDACGFHIQLSQKRVMLENQHVTIHGKSNNTIWTTCGVFCDHSYAFSASGDFVVFDIGMNIGTTALYYAGCEQVKAVHAFEPFMPTYKQARINFELNKELSDKITPYDFGLGAENKTLSIHYNPALPGSMSTVADRFQDSPDLEPVTIRNASEVLGPLFSGHTEKILLKIACEGAEMEILSTLAGDGLLQKVQAIVLEWHFHPPTDLTELLVNNGFFLFVNHLIPDELGMIYAFNSRQME